MREQLKNNPDGLELFQKLTTLFQENFSKFESKIQADSSQLNDANELNSFASSQKFKQMFQTSSFSNVQGSDVTKIMIVGAKGKQMANKINGQISSLSITEVIESQNSGISACFASMSTDQGFYLDAKVGEDS